MVATFYQGWGKKTVIDDGSNICALLSTLFSFALAQE